MQQKQYLVYIPIYCPAATPEAAIERAAQILSASEHVPADVYEDPGEDEAAWDTVAERRRPVADGLFERSTGDLSAFYRHS